MASGVGYQIRGVPGEVEVFQLGSATNPSIVFGNPNALGGLNDGIFGTSAPAVGISLNGTQQFLVSAVSHLILNTARSQDTVRVNIRTYTTDASIIGMQIKPAGGVALTNGLIGLEVEPRVNDTFAGTSITGIFAGPWKRGSGAAGNLTGYLVGIETKLQSDSGYTGTITGPAACLRAVNDLHGTITNGPAVIHVENHGGNVAWAAFVHSTQALGTNSVSTSSDKTGNAKSGTLKVEFNNTAYHIQLYADS